ncbi:hypothetical protein A2755_00650 [Candidatus Wolfebacteria bacterium RIFCSPHIGHO2_01_FULL_48_22]|uniref:Phosphoglycerate kinase n=2 Tax=Candidatus Wolfeibacteriota TaxID=1752735 RepID=A0A1F8DTB7_9BACT|nr:MAG: hypothetical protein A2755_00650 [Candidatus Wolfebacteria bacterium RIFCSPHIGHO2_01_FULL_48_22]OGM94054.1 MAG: hypothetical protein A2935_02750 [Candidatus Wolfebacteria bacterium RIFCSPLOWO2_01_FULL_47_17b]
MKFLRNIPKAKKGQIALVRIDLNIKAGDEHASLRVERAIPTIRHLLKKGYRVTLLSHRGRPRGKERLLSLRPFEKIFSDVLKTNITVFENLRFFKGEDSNDFAFARKLAKLGDVYVQDAFAFSHRKTASMVLLPKLLPSFAGLAMQEEIEKLSEARRAAQTPLTLVLGGAKISDKTPLIQSFARKADHILVGGGIANTFFYEQGIPVGDSLFDKDFSIRRFDLGLGRSNFMIPIDVVIRNKRILDIGPQTAELYADIIRKSKFVIWGGPLGDTDNKEFWGGSKRVLEAICASHVTAVIGGGETTSFVLKQHKNLPKRIFLSTGGGAMLEFLAGHKLPGIEALK